jgi:hypothetical protein
MMVYVDAVQTGHESLLLSAPSLVSQKHACHPISKLTVCLGYDKRRQSEHTVLSVMNNTEARK